jgi:CDP-2,3-bis-(O-geranylgeranyl)-sn-glycerol synthase
MNWSPFTNALLLLICANLLPWAAGRLLGAYWSAPLDLGTCLHDGRRLLGAHKTWRGLAAAIAGCALAAEVVGLQWWIGALFGALSMLGDSISSWWKRRRGYAPGRETFGLDQLPEALLPLIVLRIPLGLAWVDVALAAAVFAALDILSTRVRHPCPSAS